VYKKKQRSMITRKTERPVQDNEQGTRELQRHPAQNSTSKFTVTNHLELNVNKRYRRNPNGTNRNIHDGSSCLFLARLVYADMVGSYSGQVPLASNVLANLTERKLPTFCVESTNQSTQCHTQNRLARNDMG